MDLQKGLQPASHVALALPRTAIRIHIASDKLPTSVPPPPCRPPIWSLGALGSGDPIPSSCGRICCEIYVNPMMIIHENGLSDVKDVQSALGHNSEPKAWVTFPVREHRKDFPLISTNLPWICLKKRGNIPTSVSYEKIEASEGLGSFFANLLRPLDPKTEDTLGQLRIVFFSRRFRTSKLFLSGW